MQATAGSRAGSEVPSEIALICSRQQAPKPGQEITISYGDKSNEHLLMAYGELIAGHYTVGCHVAVCLEHVVR